MENEFCIRNSKKNIKHSSEKFIVTLNDKLLLRIMGEELNYEIITPTAGEKEYKVANQDHIIDSVNANIDELGIKPSIHKDYKGRSYLKICGFKYISDVFRFCEKIISTYDVLSEHCEENEFSISEIYSSFNDCSSGGDVYLSDGVWLSSLGGLEDRGR